MLPKGDRKNVACSVASPRSITRSILCDYVCGASQAVTGKGRHTLENWL